MRAYFGQNITIGRERDGRTFSPTDGGITIGASATNTVVTVPSTAVSHEGALNCILKITSTGVTSATGITAKLQTSTDETGTWVDSKTATIAANGDSYISLQTTRTADQQYLPLLPLIRVVVSTGAGDAVTISLVKFCQAQ